MNAAGSKPRIVAARCERHADVSNAVIAEIPEAPDATASASAAWPSPNEEMHPMPVMTTRSRTEPLPYHAGPHASTIAVALLLLACSAATDAARDRFAEIFARTLQVRQTMHSIRARFTETTTSSLLQKPLVAHGTVLAAPPSRVLMTYTDPERRIVAIDDQSLTVSWPDRGEREAIDIRQTQKRIDQYFAHASLDALRSMFEIVVEPDAAVRGADRVDLRPKRKPIKAGLERLQLWIDRESLLLVQMQMTFPGGDTKSIRLDEVTLNVPVTDEMFRIR